MKIQATVTLEPDRFATLVAMAEREGVARNELSRALIDEALASYAPPAERRPKYIRRVVPGGGQRMIANLEPATYERLRGMARAERSTIATLLRRLIGAGLDARSKGPTRRSA
jgi:predicted DNA-binding ribbon-helix-helix protein